MSATTQERKELPVTKAELVAKVASLETALSVEKRAREEAERRLRDMEPMPEKAKGNFAYWRDSELERETWQQRYTNLRAENSRITDGLGWLATELCDAADPRVNPFGRFVKHLLRWPVESHPAGTGEEGGQSGD